MLIIRLTAPTLAKFFRPSIDLSITQVANFLGSHQLLKKPSLPIASSPEQLSAKSSSTNDDNTSALHKPAEKLPGGVALCVGMRRKHFVSHVCIHNRAHPSRTKESNRLVQKELSVARRHITETTL